MQLTFTEIELSFLLYEKTHIPIFFLFIFMLDDVADGRLFIV